jgi:hypothetical protein
MKKTPARKTADERFIPGTAEFNAAFDKVTADPIY